MRPASRGNSVPPLWPTCESGDTTRASGCTNWDPCSKDLKSKLEYEKVKDDEMIQEGIQESLSEKIVKLRVVDKIKNGYYNGTAFEDGILYLEVSTNVLGCRNKFLGAHSDSDHSCQLVRQHLRRGKQAHRVSLIMMSCTRRMYGIRLVELASRYTYAGCV